MLVKDLQYKDLEEIQNNMKFLIRSEVRIEILNHLFLKPATKKELKNKTDLTYTSINGNLKQLKELGFVRQIDDEYDLTNTFRINFSNLLNLKNAVNFVDSEKDFLNNHKLFNKNLMALWDVAPLESLELVTTDNTDVHRVTHLIKDFFIGSHTIKSVFPYLHPEYGEIFEDWLEKDVGVKLILPNDVSSALIDIISNYTPKIGIKNRYIKVKTLNRDLNLVVILSDKGVLIGNYKKDGTFNKNAVFVSRDEKAIEWGADVYAEYESLGGDYFSLDETVYKNEEERLKKKQILNDVCDEK